MKKRIPVWKKATGRRGRTARFFQEHERLLTFVGAIIIFATFVMREGVREYLRSTSEAMHAAQTIYSNMTDTIESTTLSGVPANILEKFHDLAQDDYDEHPTDKATDILEVRPFLYKELVGTKLVMNETLRFVSALPDPWDKDGDVRGLDNKFDNEEDLYDGIPRLSKAQFLSEPPKARDVERGVIEREYAAFSADHAELEKELSSLTKGFVNEAEEKKVTAERWFRVATIASYILYSLGWGLGLVGKLCGLGLAGGE
jgi:hypothetical protein